MGSVAGSMAPMEWWEVKKAKVKETSRHSQQRVGTSAASGSFAVTAEIKNTDDASHSVTAFASLADSTGNVVAELSEVIPLHAQSGHSVTFNQQLDTIQLWSAEAPNLYDLTLSIKDSTGTVLEVIRQRVGFRTVSIDGTVFKFGDDAISDQVACAYNGGVKPASPLKAQEAKMETSSAAPVKPKRASVQNTQRKNVPDGTFDSKNKAVAWTAGCYAEFGPNATNPDAVLLDKCLGN